MENATFHTRLDSYIADLQRVMVSVGLCVGILHSKRNSRFYAYSDILGESCREYFRYRNGVVFVHNGRVWEPISVGLLRSIVKGALVGASGSDADVMKGDWVDREKKLMEYAMNGIIQSELEYSSSVVGFQNGVWDFCDIDSPVRHRFSERMPVTDLLPYDYDGDAGCPVWLGFLNMMLRKKDIEVLQKFFGLGCMSRRLLGQSVEESLWLIGDGANGKSTIQSVMRGVFGAWNVSSTRLDALLDRNVDARMRAVASIEGRIFNMCDEISGADVERGSDMFKSLVSGAPQDARSLSRNIWTATDIPYFVFSMNQLPSNKKMDDAFRRRMVTIDFRASVRREDMDRSLGQKLAAEYSGIRNWAMDGYRMLVRDRFSVRPLKGGEALTDEDMDMMIGNGLTVDIWRDHASISASRHIGHEDDEVCVTVRSTDLYQDYVRFCENRLMCEPATANQFGRDLRRLHFESRRESRGVCYRVYCDRKNKFNV